jgi:hypothetical protein
MGAIIVIIVSHTWASSNKRTFLFLPSQTIFAPLIIDPRELGLGLVKFTNINQWEGSIGESYEIMQYRPDSRNRWGFGIRAAAFPWLGQEGRTFPMRANDWWLGVYLSHSNGNFSSRLEYTHISAHLGDALFEEQSPIVYSREFIRWLFSYNFLSQIRIYGGGGALVHSIPTEKPLFFQAGFEFFTLPLFSNTLPIQWYTGCDFQYQQELGGIVDVAAQLGIRLAESSKISSRGIRIAISYYDGNYQWGQFFNQRDSNFGLGIYFDN